MGIGRTLLKWLQSEGLEVRGTTRFPSPDSPELLGADFSSSAGVDAFLGEHQDWLSEVDLVILNAGSADFGFFPNQSEAGIERQLQLMLGSVIQLSRGLWPALSRKPGGACVFINSLAGQFPIPGFPVYNAAKAGLSQFVESLLVEEGQGGPQILNCCLGDFRTNFNQHVTQPIDTSKEEEKAWARIEETMSAAPDPKRLVRCLERRLQKGHSGSWKMGSAVQAFWAPLAARLLPASWMRRLVRRYYHQ